MFGHLGFRVRTQPIQRARVTEIALNIMTAPALELKALVTTVGLDALTFKEATQTAVVTTVSLDVLTYTQE